jgi:hypothetical protein
VDRGGAAKSSPMKILQYRPAGSHALENADDQNAIAFLPPKSHIQPLGYGLGISTRLFNFGERVEVRLAAI